ncbi:hypothetical protein ACFFRR_008676 [Megaselia abdita]
MRALQLVPIWVLVAVCFAEPVYYVYPSVAGERLGRSQNLEKVDLVYPYVEEVEVKTPMPLEDYYKTTSTEVPETTTDIPSLRSLDNEVYLTTTETPENETTITTEGEIVTTTTTEIPSTTTLAPSTTTVSTETPSTERGKKSILSWKERMLENLQKRPKFPKAKIQRKFYIAQNYGKSRYSSNKTYKTTTTTSTTTTEEPSSSERTQVPTTRRAFNREKYSLKRRRTTTTTTEIPTTTTTSTSTTTSETSTIAATSEPYRKKFGRGRARFLKFRSTKIRQ